MATVCLTAGSVYLDIGSGSSPVPTFLYQRRHATTFATEMDRKYLDRQKSYMETLGLGKRDSFVPQQEDATQLSFADGSVDFVSAISTIEHIPGDGDVRSMAEFARVLRPGGRLVVTVPTAANYIENESTFYYAGFERRYDAAALQTRLWSSGAESHRTVVHGLAAARNFSASSRRRLPKRCRAPDGAMSGTRTDGTMNIRT